MPKDILYPLDFNKNEIQNALAHVLASAPGTPVEGQFYYNSTTKRIEWRSDAAWIDPTARANHSGTQLAATISDFDAQVRTNRLDQMAAPTADVSLNSRKITNLAEPTSAQDAATKAYVDALNAGISWKDSVRAATTAAGTLATSFEDGDVIDGVTLATGDRILIKDQAAGAENGIYTVNASGAPTRATDSDTGADIKGAAVFVEEGTVNGDTGWICTTNAPITIDTTALTFTQFTGVGELVAGAGLTKTGNQIDAGAGTGIVVNPDNIAIDTTVVARKYATDIGDGSATAIVVTHNLGTRDVVVSVYSASGDFDEVMCGVEKTSINTVTLRFSVAPTTNQYRVAIVG